jgi:hypothetical protein
MTPRHTTVAFLAISLLWLTVSPAFALTSIDPTTGVNNFNRWAFALATGVVALIFLGKGIAAMVQGERWTHHLPSLLGGLAIALGGITIATVWDGGIGAAPIGF